MTTLTRGSVGEVLARCAELDVYSSLPDALERVHLSAEHAAVNRVVARWMEQAGMRTWQDAAGNICGRREGRRPGAPALLLGSHLDTVTDAGCFDGMLGVVMAIAVVQRLDSVLDDFPFAIEVIGFSDEEGTRFGKALLGSHAVAGTWDASWWDLTDHHGTSLREASVAFGLDPEQIGAAARRPEELVGYLEAHIEQGPFLEAADVSLGYVTSIAGAVRFQIDITGEARHAGGTPYNRRRDALTGASEAILAIERIGKASGSIATVGRIRVRPGGVNVIPGRAEFSLDLRGENDAERNEAWAGIQDAITRICHRRSLTVEITETHRAPAVHCAAWLRQAVIDGIVAAENLYGSAPLGLWSRAGHDAMAMAAVTDVGMLFLRCFDGISHHPGESVRVVDVRRGLDAFERAVLAVAARTPTDEPPDGHLFVSA